MTFAESGAICCWALQFAQEGVQIQFLLCTIWGGGIPIMFFLVRITSLTAPNMHWRILKSPSSQFECLSSIDSWNFESSNNNPSLALISLDYTAVQCVLFHCWCNHWSNDSKLQKEYINPPFLLLKRFSDVYRALLVQAWLHAQFKSS